MCAEDKAVMEMLKPCVKFQDSSLWEYSSWVLDYSIYNIMTNISLNGMHQKLRSLIELQKQPKCFTLK